MPIPSALVAPVQTVVLPQGFPGTGPPTNPAGSGWEVQVWDHTFGILLAYVPSWMALSFSPLGNDKGAGSIQLPLSSPVLQASGSSGSPILNSEVMFRVLQNGVARFDFLGETVTRSEADTSEQQSVTIAGPGTAQCLTWGMAMPLGWPTANFGKASGIVEQFDIPDPTGSFYELDTLLWNLTTPGAVNILAAGSAQIEGLPTGAYLGGGPFDMTSSSFSVQVNPVTDVNGGTDLDGSQVAQLIITAPGGTANGYAMIALTYQAFYFQFKDAEGNLQTKQIAVGVGGTAVTSSGPFYDSSWAQYWRISCDVTPNGTQTWGFWASGDGTNWSLYWQVSPNQRWDATHADIFIGAIYDSLGIRTYITISSINGEVISPPSYGPVFLTQPLMRTWLSLLAACQARGTIPFIAPSFSNLADSNLELWSDAWSIQVPVGTNLFTLLQEFAGAIGGDFIMQPGFFLQVGAQGSLGTVRTQTVIFPDGQVTQKGRTQARDQIGNLVAAQDADGQIHTVSDSASIGQWQQREWFASSGGTIDGNAASQLAEATLLQVKSESDARVLQIPPNLPGRTVFQDFTIFDWIGVERADLSAVDACRVIGITVAVDQDGAETHELILQTYRQWYVAQLAYLISKFGGQSASTLGALPVQAGSGGIPATAIVSAPPVSSNTQSASTSPSSSAVATVPTLSALPEVVQSSGVPGGLISPGSISREQLSFSAGSTTVTVGSAPPATPNVGDLWMNVANGNMISQWNGTAWVPVQFGPGAVLFTAQQIGGVFTYFQSTPPTGATTGSLWFDTSHGLRLNQWNGTVWLPFQWGTAAISAGAITAAQIVAGSITAQQIQAGTITADQIAANTITANNIQAGTITAGLLAAGIVVAGIINGTTVVGATIETASLSPGVEINSSGDIIIFNSHGAIAVQITPSTEAISLYADTGSSSQGALIMSIASASGTDPVTSTAFGPGITVGSNASNTPQVALVPAPGGPGSPAELQFTLSPSSFFSNQPNIASASPSSNGELFVSGPALQQSGFTDWVQNLMFSFSGSSPAAQILRYIDANGSTHDMERIDNTGVTLIAKRIDATEPGTGTSNTNAATPEPWHSGSLINSWAGGGGNVNGLWYRMLPWGVNGTVEVIADIQNSSATGNSVCFQLPSGYQPGTAQNHSAAWNDPASSNSATAPWINVATNGNIQVTGIQVANKEIWFHIYIPLETL